MAIRKRLKQGFTLIELMIVVTIVGVLATLAVYGVRKYLANAKTSEAKNALGEIGKDAIAAFEAAGGEKGKNVIIAPGGATKHSTKICPSAGTPVPATLAGVKGGKYQAANAEWEPPLDVIEAAGFPCLKFHITLPQYYMYTYTSDSIRGNPDDRGSVFLATAQGDLNGDGIPSTFTIKGKVSAPADGSRLLVSPSIDEVSPEE